MSAVDEAEGKTAEDLAAEGEQESEGDQMLIPGTSSGLTLNAGGSKPQASEMKMKGGSLPVRGEYKKGDRIRLMVEVTVTEVHFVDALKEGEIVGTIRRHVGKLSQIEPLPTAPDTL